MGIASLCPKQQHVRVQLSPWHASGMGKAGKEMGVSQSGAREQSGAGGKPRKTSYRLHMCVNEVLIASPKPPEVRMEKTPRANRQGKR